MILALTAVVFGLAGCKSGWSIKNPISSVSNPFASKPKPVESPAEMDNIKLKAPPENYTKKDSGSKKDSAESLAQNGSYQSPRAGSVAKNAGETPGFTAPAVEVAMNPNGNGNSYQLQANGANGQLGYTGTTGSNGAVNSQAATGLGPAPGGLPNVAPQTSSAPSASAAAPTMPNQTAGTLPSYQQPQKAEENAAPSPYEAAPTDGYSVPGFNSAATPSVYGSGSGSTAAPFAPGSIGGY